MFFCVSCKINFYECQSLMVEKYRRFLFLSVSLNVLFKFHISGNDWFLSKSDMYGDPAEPLENPDATLMELLVNDGDILILKPGTLVKKVTEFL